jgi:hypothetical protein
MAKTKILKYVPTPGAPINTANAEIFGRELHRIAKLDHDAGLTPERIVTEAKQPGSPLYPWFQWDDPLAAESWRKQQARILCNSISVELIAPNGGRYTMPLLESVRVQIVDTDGEETGTERRYVTVKILEKEETARDSVREDAIRRLAAAVKTMEDISILGNEMLPAELRKIIDSLKSYIDKIKVAA